MLSKEDRAARWRQLFKDQQSSGLSVAAWCRDHGVESSSFYGWRRRLSLAPVVMSSPRQFISLSLASAVHEPANLTLPVASLTLRVGRVAIEVSPGFDAPLLADVLSVLEARC